MTRLALFRNRAVALMGNWASTFHTNLNPSDEATRALCSAAWPTPNQCALIDWKQWRAEFNREINLMQQTEPCSIFEGRTIEDARTRIQHMRRCDDTRWKQNELARRFAPEPCVQRAATYFDAMCVEPFRKLCSAGVAVNVGQYVIDVYRPFLITKEPFRQLRVRKEALLLRLQTL